MSIQDGLGDSPAGSVAAGPTERRHHIDESPGTTGHGGAAAERGVSGWIRWVGVGLASLALASGLTACDSDGDGEGEHGAAVNESGQGSEGSDEHGIGEGSEGSGEYGGVEGSEGSGEGLGEESGRRLTLADTFDEVRAGARLVLVHDPAANAFVGTVENVTSGDLENVRVEVHLSNGVELGPTTPVDLAPGQIADVELAATEAPFDGWSPHAEVGPSGAAGNEHGPDGEERTASEGGGEHDG